MSQSLIKYLHTAYSGEHKSDANVKSYDVKKLIYEVEETPMLYEKKLKEK